MFFTFYYMYATVLQWWRLGSLKNKLNGTLNSKNALLACSETVVYDTKKSRSFETLLFHNEDRIGCTVVPKQRINLSQWIGFPRDHKFFPIYFRESFPKIESPNIYIVVQAMLDTYVKHSADLIQIEHFGELLAWRTADYFEAIVKTDFDKLTKLVHCFSQNSLDINHELKLLRIETVDVEGIPMRIRYERKFSTESTLKYSHSPIHWKKFSECVREIYSKVRDTTNPKIMIENGDYRRHKSGEHKRDKSSEKHRDHTKVNGTFRGEGKSKEDRKQKDSKAKDAKKEVAEVEEKKEDHKLTVSPSRSKKLEKEMKDDVSTSKQHKVLSKTRHKSEKPVEIADKTESNAEEPHKKSKSDLEKPAKVASSNRDHKTLSKQGSEKKLVKSVAVCDENDGDTKIRKSKDKHKLKSRDSKSQLLSASDLGSSSGVMLNRSNNVKPPNILVYADSHVAKENVKSALATMLNKDKYIIYDLPVDSDKIIWDSSTILVVVCGTVVPSLAHHLVQYLLNGGQLLCLCSDLLYSVLYTFTTAEVREHELVRFSYGKWQQVKMMHHIFCYQASPAKKQFSRDSDHSNHSSGNGSSPIAPRTPSTVEIQHNGNDYLMQVQVLGTEETWQTPSLLLASVKGGEGRAIFSQVHLEINPSQYEDDEDKFKALKESDQARMEILRDILSNHLDIDCNNSTGLQYGAGFFLGRHEMKLKLLKDSDAVNEYRMECGKITLKFCGKDETPEAATDSFMPVFIHSCPSNFSTVNYFEGLETECVGRLVIYCDIVTSSQHVLGQRLAHGLVVIARQQTQGVGRSKNVWLSPVGSANFSLQLHIPLDSPLGKSLSLIQHLTMVGVVAAIRSTKGCQELAVGIKWPNDLYANGSTKVGGVVVNSVIVNNMAIVNIGCGVNLDNTNPTVSINDLIRGTNSTEEMHMKVISYEAYFATVFNEIEKIYDIVQNGNINYLYELYYKYWLHKGSNVTVTNKAGVLEKAVIAGIDEYGYLQVKLENGLVSKVEPDGNTFDMMKGLICPKSF